MIFRKAEIGIILIGCSVLAFGFWVVPIGVLVSMWQLNLSGLTFNTIISGPSIVLAIAGLVLYIRGRKMFWKAKRELNAVVLLTFVGVTLILLGVWFSLQTYYAALYYAGKPWSLVERPFIYYLALESPDFLWFALWFISGVILLADIMLAVVHTRFGKQSDSP